ncbi:MAG TPA: complement resistance protein TraT [Nitrospiraceae bacterium]|nr:complement resistance protein TraT [Nitrospiraceae bacterium]
MAGRFVAGFTISVLLCAGCSANVRDTDLLASNTVMLPPSSAKTVFIQVRNSSDNQAVGLQDLSSRLSAKGYRVVSDPQSAAYVLLTNIVYCNQTKVEMPVDDIVAGGYGSGFNSVMSGLSSLSGLTSMAGPQGAVAGAAASMGIGAISSIGNSVGNLFGGPSGPKFDENINYACVADVQITERAESGMPTPSTASHVPSSAVYQTRLAASVHQTKLDAQEATPLVQQRLSAAVAGHF